MSYNSIHISIPKPCHEAWDRMDPTERGAFCQSCQKEVIDYSSMTDREVIEHLTNAKRGCGRFRSDQVEAPLSLPRLNNGFMKWRAILLGLLPIFAFRDAIASQPRPVLSDQTTLNKDIKPTSTLLPEHIIVNGLVINEKGEPVMANIQVIDSAGDFIGPAVGTDKKGRFTLQAERKVYKDKLPFLKINSRNYNPQYISLTKDKIQAVKIKMIQQTYIVGDWYF